MELPKRKPTRLKEYDYSSNGAYFITICSYKRKCIFSDIVGAIHESPENKLTQYGEIVENVISEIPERFDVEIDKYIIMPNHIHILLTINRNEFERAIRESPLRNKRSVISNCVGFLKMNVSKQIHLTEPDINIWQRSFHDHIIRNENDYLKIWEYIDTNVFKWERDCFYMH